MDDGFSSRSTVRAGDADRERVAEQLRRHFADGRLTADELSERTDRAYAARTLAELESLVADLPALAPATVPAPAVAREERAKERRELFAHATTYVVLNVMLVVIWALTGRDGSFWPIWPIVGWGFALALHAAGALTGLPIGRPRSGPLAIPERVATGRLHERPEYDHRRGRRHAARR